MVKKEWTDAQDKYIMKNFGKVSIKDMAEELNVTQQRLIRRIDTILEPTYRNFKSWTEVEDEVLLAYYGKISNEELAFKLKRNVNSIIIRLHRNEGLTDISSVTGLLTTSDLCSIMGVDHKTIRRWINKGWLKCYRPNRKILFNEYYFWNWLKENMNRVNYKRVDEYILKISPNWYANEVKQKQRELYSNEKMLKYGTPYSPIENALIWDMKVKGYKESDIAKEVNRTLDSVKQQLHKLRKNRKFVS